MDTKTKERVISILLKHKKDDSFREYFVSNAYGTLLDELSDLDADVIWACLEDLESDGYVSDILSSKTAISPKAIGYIRKIEEERQLAKDKKWEDRKWSLIQVGIGAVLGLILGVISTVAAQIALKKFLPEFLK